MDSNTQAALAHVFMLAQSQHTEWSGICEGIAGDQEDLSQTELYLSLAQLHDEVSVNFRNIANILMNDMLCEPHISTAAAVRMSQEVINEHLTKNTELADMLKELARA